MSVLALVVAGFAPCQQIDSDTARFSEDNASRLQLFGASVACTRYTEAVNGNVGGYLLVVGAPGEDAPGCSDCGAVYVYDNGALVAAPTPSPAPVEDDHYGEVAVYGSTLVVSAFGADATGAANSGAVYIFTRDAAGAWTQRQFLDATTFGAGEDDGFGDVDIHEGRIIVGARLADVGTLENAGRAFVIEDTGGATPWSSITEFELTPTPANALAAGDEFGSVAIWGDYVVVGARRRDVIACPSLPQGTIPGGCDHGAAYVFERTGVGMNPWQEVAVLTWPMVPMASAPEVADEFGFSVDVSGDWIVVGAPGRDIQCNASSQEPNCDSGAARLFRRMAGVWTDQGFQLSAFDSFVNLPNNVPLPFERFGYSVAIDGGRIVCGAPGRFSLIGTEGTTLVTGAAYTFEVNASDNWSPARFIEDDQIAMSVPDSGAFFGSSVDAACNLIAVGAPLDSSPGSLMAGQGYTFYHYPELAITPHEASCFGDGGDQMGCTDCPCGNNAPIGTIGGCLNGVGTSARLFACGVASCTTGRDTLRFEMTGGNPSTFGLLLVGDSLLPVMSPVGCPPGSGISSVTLDGLRCVGNGVFRAGSRPTAADGSIGIRARGWGTPDGPPGGLCAFIGLAAGQTRHFQCFYREDPGLSCGTEQNTTNAISVTFVP